MCILCCMRDLDCGTDTINYYQIFFLNSELSDQRLEPLFLLVRNSISNFQVFLSFFAITTYLIIYEQCAKRVRYTSLAILIFMITPTKFFPESFNIIRQSLASAIILWGIVEWNKKKIIPTLVLFTIATLFHYSSIIAFLLMFIPRHQISFKCTTLLVIITCILGIKGTTSLIVQKFVIFLGETDIHPVISAYARYAFRVDNTMQFSSLILWLVPLSFFAITCYPFNEKAKEKYGYYYNVFLIGTILGNLFIPALDWGIRFVFSIMIIQILVIPLALEYAENKQKVFIVGATMICSAAYLFYIYHLQFFGETSIVPYRSIMRI